MLFYWSKKKYSCGTSSADLRSWEETPLRGVIAPCVCTFVNTASVSSVLGDSDGENLTCFISSAS